jgi:hypothetical protein
VSFHACEKVLVQDTGSRVKKPRPLPGEDDRMVASRESFHVSMVAGGQSDIQCQVGLREERSRTFNSGLRLSRPGALLLRGFGSDWITDGPTPSRGRFEAVVELENATDTGPCRVLDFQSDKAGTALLSLDLSSVYRPAAGSAVEARRQVAVDYTGRSGADALVVVLDRIHGQGKKTWTLPIGVQYVDYGQRTYHAERVWEGHTAKYVIESVAAPGERPKNEFLLRRGAAGQRSSATVRGVILRPVEYAVGVVPTATKGTLPVLQVAAAAEEVEFFVVLTLQKDLPPPVSFQADGPNGVLKVGQQKATITGGRISWDR